MESKGQKRQCRVFSLVLERGEDTGIFHDWDQGPGLGSGAVPWYGSRKGVYRPKKS